jgi:hypothetical protein
LLGIGEGVATVDALLHDTNVAASTISATRGSFESGPRPELIPGAALDRVRAVPLSLMGLLGLKRQGSNHGYARCAIRPGGRPTPT